MREGEGDGAGESEGGAEEWAEGGAWGLEGAGPRGGGGVRLRLRRRRRRRRRVAERVALSSRCAAHLRGLGDQHRVGLGGVEQVVREGGRELGQLHLVAVELLLRLALQTDAGQLHRLG